MLALLLTITLFPLDRDRQLRMAPVTIMMLRYGPTGLSISVRRVIDLTGSWNLVTFVSVSERFVMMTVSPLYLTCLCLALIVWMWLLVALTLAIL